MSDIDARRRSHRVRLLIAAIALFVCVSGVACSSACSRAQYTKVTRTDGSTVIGTLVTMRPDVVILQTRQGQVEIRRSDVKSLDVPTISEIAELEGAQSNQGATARNGTGGTTDPAAQNGGPDRGNGSGTKGSDPGGPGGQGGQGGGAPGGGSPGGGGAGSSGSASGGSASGGSASGGSASGAGGNSGAGSGGGGAGGSTAGTGGSGSGGSGSGGAGSGAAASGGAANRGAANGDSGRGTSGYTSGGGTAGQGAPYGTPASGGAGTQTGRNGDGAGSPDDDARPGPSAIPAGTAFTVTFDAPLGSDTSRVEEAVTATLIAPIAIGAARVVPAGAVLRGRVTEVASAKAAGGRGRVTIRFHTLVIGARTSAIDGPTLPIVAQVFTREDKRKVGIGAAAGAVLGGIVSRTKKAVGIGAAAGAGGAAAAVGVRNDLRLARGAKVRLQFTQPVAVPPPPPPPQ
jgi:hypothetical protein